MAVEQLFRGMMREGRVISGIVLNGQFIRNRPGKDGLPKALPDGGSFCGMNENDGCALIVVQFRKMQVHAPKVSQCDVGLPAFLVGGAFVA